MASTYVNDLRLNELATGDASGTWGTITNTNLELVAEAFSFGTEGITTNADTHTSTIADGATDPVRSMYVKYTGTLDSACTITIAPNTVSKLWFIENGTSGSQNIIISQGTGANVTIPAGDTKVVYSDGAGSGAAVVDAFASLSTVDLKVQDDLTVTDDASIGGDATVTGTLGVSGLLTANANITLAGTTPTLTIGDAGAEDTKIVFDGNAQDYYIGLDDSADDLIIGRGSTVGTTPAIVIDENLNVGIGTTPNLGALHVVSTTTDIVTFENTDAGTTGAQLILYHNSSSPADGDRIGALNFKGEDDAGNDHTYAGIRCLAADVSDASEDGTLTFSTSRAGSFTEAARINEDGKLIIGATSSQTSDTLQIETPASGGGHGIQIRRNDNNTDQTIGHIKFGNVVDSDIGQIHTKTDGANNSGAMIFSTASSGTTSERARIDSDGNLLLGTTTRINNSNTIAKTTDHVPLNIRRDNGASDNSILICIQGTNTAKMAVRGDGDLENVNNSYGALSDERLKSNIVDANSQLEDIKKVKVRNYTLDSTGETHIGVIAQELEAEGMNGLVVEREEGYKGVKYSILFMKAIKAIQEQQTQIEALQSEINTLKGG
jgi:hypothetical protein